MISDILFKAIQDIEEGFLNEPTHKDTYTGLLRQKIIILLGQMNLMRMELDDYNK